MKTTLQSRPTRCRREGRSTFLRPGAFGLAFATVLMLIAGCDRRVYYSSEADVDEKGWNIADPVSFDVEIEDTLDVYNFYIDLRNNTHFATANAFLFITTTFPDGSYAYDTMECPLADVEGHWYGKRTGRYIDNRYYFRKHVIFPLSGNYHFEIAHGMRDTNVVGLKSVGMRIECIDINR